MILGLLTTLIIYSCKDKDPKPQVVGQGITGKITDSKTGGAIEGATVTLTPTNQTKTTGSDGIYSFTNLSELNNYTITVTKSSYKTITENGLQVRVGETATKDIKLEREALNLEILPLNLTFSGNERSKPISIKNTSGQGTVEVTVSSEEKWISFNKSVLSIKEGLAEDLTVSVNPAGLTPNSYSAKCTFNFTSSTTNNANSVAYFVNLVVADPDAPSISTSEPAGITQTTADVIGKVLKIGGSPIVKYGICWSDKPNPLPDTDPTEQKQASIATGKDFIMTAKNLTAGKTYFVRAFAVNSNGLGLGEVKQFSTSLTTTSPTVDMAVDADTKNATLSGKVTNNGGSPVTNVGFCWNTNSATPPNIKTDSIRSLRPDANGNFSTVLTNLTAGKTYYVRAYAINDLGNEKPGYSRVLPFTLEVAPANPIINTFTPTTGGYDTEVTINGDNFDLISSNNKVFFGTVQASKVVVKSKQQLIATVPEGAPSGIIRVQVGQNKGDSPSTFIYTLTPVIESITNLDTRLFINDITVACDGGLYLCGVSIDGNKIVKNGIYSISKSGDEKIIYEGSPGYVNGPLAGAKFYNPTKITCANGDIYVADHNNYKGDSQEEYASIRRISNGTVDMIYYKKMDNDNGFIHELFYNSVLNGLLFTDGSFYKYDPAGKNTQQVSSYDGLTTAIDFNDKYIYTLDLSPATIPSAWALNQRTLPKLTLNNSISSGKLLTSNVVPVGMAIDPDRNVGYFVEKNATGNYRISEMPLKTSAPLTTLYNGEAPITTRPVNNKLSPDKSVGNVRAISCMTYDPGRKGLVFVDVDMNGTNILRILRYK